ncbi:MAG: fibronectin type III domain-containing protein, partial [Spirochaetales bacterium]|nr:fibronectin type III domain-containing protein [Spirochaetales bacterium]
MKKSLLAIISIAIMCTFFSCEEMVDPVTDFTANVTEEGTSVLLKWTQPAGTTAVILYGPENAKEEDLKKIEIDSKSREKLIENLEKGVKYQFIIYAVNVNGIQSVIEKQTTQTLTDIEIARKSKKTELLEIFGALKEADYSAENWTKVVKAKDDTLAAIDLIEDGEELGFVILAFAMQVDGIPTIEDEMSVDPVTNLAVTANDDGVSVKVQWT